MGYVGMTKAKRFKRRMLEHRKDNARNGRRQCRVDQVIQEYGWENFTAEVIEICDAEVAPERERHWIKKLNTKVPHGYNCTNGGETFREMSTEERVQLSANQIKKPFSPYYRLNSTSNK